MENLITNLQAIKQFTPLCNLIFQFLKHHLFIKPLYQFNLFKAHFRIIFSLINFPHPKSHIIKTSFYL